MVNLLLCVVLPVIWTFRTGLCSFVELNDTTLASLPPLYGLDDWSQCQRPGDVYCIVDASLQADGPSTTLALLEVYSSETLKHYNRTLLHRGVCVSRCQPANTSLEVNGSKAGDGSYADDGSNAVDGSQWYEAAQRCVQESMNKYDLKVHVLSVDWCRRTQEPRQGGPSARALAIFCVVLLAITFAATALNVLCLKCANFQGNKYLLAFSLKQNWSILMYDRSKPTTDDRMKDIACLEGIRFLGMQCVIFSHVLVIFFYSYIDNPQYVERMYDGFGWQAVMNSPLWLQAFFSLSGFLTSYMVLLGSERSPLTFVKCLLAIVYRYVRITPLAAFALWFVIAWFPLLGSGPQWEWLVTRESQDCSERWWYHMLYVHNHLPLGKLCMGQTWYLAVDMQLHIIGMFMLLILMKNRRAAIPILTALILASSFAAGFIAYWNELQPIITAQSPEALRTMFLGSTLMSTLYLPIWTNVAGYASGVAVAFILFRNHEKGVKLSQSKWFNVLFHSSLFIGGAVVLSGTVFLQDSPPPHWAAPVYAALDRTVVAVCFGIFMLGCVSRCHSALRSALSWRGFHPLGRLSYCAFLFHFIVLRLTLASNTQLGHATLFSLIALLVTASTLTYAVSVPLCLLLELPAIQLWKAMMSQGPAHDEERPQPAVAKSFDLLSPVGRQRSS